MANRPGKVTEPIAIRKWGKGSSGPSGTATPRFAQKTTTAEALPFDSYDAAVEAGGVSEPVTTTTQGALEGFDDNRGGIRKFIDSLSGRQSTADALNAQLAIGRDTTAQQLAGNLAVGEQGNAARLRELTAKAGFDLKQAERIQEMTGAREMDLNTATHLNTLKQQEALAQQALTKARADGNIAEERAANDQLRSIALKTHEQVLKWSGDQNLPFDPEQNAIVANAARGAAVAKQEAAQAAAHKTATLDKLQTSAISNQPKSIYDAEAAANANKPWADNYAKTVTPLGQYGTIYPGNPASSVDPAIRFTPGTPSTAAALGIPAKEGTPPTMDVMRALSALTGEGVTSPMFGKGNVANNYGMPTTAKPSPASVVTPQAVPQQPQSTGLFPAIRRGISTLPAWNELRETGTNIERMLHDVVDMPAVGSPEYTKLMQARELEQKLRFGSATTAKKVRGNPINLGVNGPQD